MNKNFLKILSLSAFVLVGLFKPAEGQKRCSKIQEACLKERSNISGCGRICWELFHANKPFQSLFKTSKRCKEIAEEKANVNPPCYEAMCGELAQFAKDAKECVD